ncbi:MAG: VWA domain-containing protein [Acidianus infernus]|uniref:VWA domain-containing protein n=1 Tax=Acidianus infernus TaxID=12915 RepID=UPI00227510B7|nr:VWA domain-containing protein [Acidianus infernus]
MTISLKIKTSHKYVSRNDRTEVGILIYIVPEKYSVNANIRYIIAVDNSPSMKDHNKFETAVNSAQTLLSHIPSANNVIIILFSNHPEIIYNGPGGNQVSIPRKFGGTTRLHEAIRKIIEIASDGIPTKAILLTDGKPTDKTNVSDYEALQIPTNLTFISIGIGKDYNEVILKRLSDKSAGVFYHIEDVSQMPNVLEEQRTTSTYALNLTLDLPQGFYPFNYELPIFIPIVDKLIAIYGTMIIDPGNLPVNLTFTANYTDPVDSQYKVISSTITLERAEDDIVRSTINSDVLAEIKYYRLLKEYGDMLAKGKDTTRIMAELMQTAKETGNQALIEETQKLTGYAKADLSEVTKKMRS